MNIRTVCLVGGSGFVGRHVAELLCGAGLQVRIPTRIRERVKEDLILLPTAEVVQADVHDPASLQRVLRDVDAVINLVGVLHDGSGRGFEKNHVSLPSRIVGACRDAGIARLLHVSALGADASAPSAYLRSKAGGEREISRAGEHGIATTIFRPSVIFGRGDSFLSLFAGLARAFPVLPLGGAQARFQPVFVEDVARALAASLSNPATFGMTYELCGPRVYTLRELVEYAGRITGAPRPVIPLPMALARIQAAVLERLPGRLMTRDNLRSMQVDNVCGCPFPDEFGFLPTALETIAPIYLAGQAARADRYSRMRLRARR